MKFCRNCGEELAPNVLFCGKCGTKVQQETSVLADAPKTGMNAQKKKLIVFGTVIAVIVLGMFYFLSNQSPFAGQWTLADDYQTDDVDFTLNIKKNNLFEFMVYGYDDYEEVSYNAEFFGKIEENKQNYNLQLEKMAVTIDFSENAIAEFLEYSDASSFEEYLDDYLFGELESEGIPTTVARKMVKITDNRIKIDVTMEQIRNLETQLRDFPMPNLGGVDLSTFEEEFTNIRMYVTKQDQLVIRPLNQSSEDEQLMFSRQ
ncbi:zinc-ribbon domain-containing protein [Enterococcus saccharolyticus]|uniref:Zinc-ribbon domain-containing protein n=1 Tax=Enterococcus saccharolyticus subsp. saccharolyticus ATCC 43076 TaxID=1139996 RepID=S0NWV7_9ENTE|nr:zinc ribbon domain-containing protein [Enterococcus saccharolyticus]EOT29184.1 hypothetical protein OMQ_01136 [Enterococcus saccharolyticus subsp. saccharolyticus ATCC 43076]EOT80983.1 hypothetical protein I572_01515 [Enterococcus saccharolyticus subsp. saccharolyticus ATCC 43076]OJG84996.1 hypothetical protein RV16_GL001424 [Enterococcus saccharolyticus]